MVWWYSKLPDVLRTVSSDGNLPGDKCKLLSFDQGTCSIFHLPSQVLLHESFLAVLSLPFQGSSQATPCQYQLTCPSRLGFTHLFIFQINTFLLLPGCYFVKKIYIYIVVVFHGPSCTFLCLVSCSGSKHCVSGKMSLLGVCRRPCAAGPGLLLRLC